MILPALLPDETFFSLLVRLARLNGFSDLCDVVAKLSGEPGATSFIDATFRMTEFSRATDGAYGEELAILRDSSELYALVRLGELEWVALSKVANGVAGLGTNEFGLRSRSILRYCESCVQEDIKLHGFSYWHRAHQIPVISCCARHRCSLIELKCNRPQLHHWFPVPADDPLPGVLEVFPSTALPSEAKYDLAAIAKDILDDQSELFTDRTVAEAYRSELRERGLLTARGLIRVDEFVRQLRQFLASRFSEFRGHQRDMEKVCGALLMSLCGGETVRPFSRLILVYWLFGSWAAFHEKCVWSDILGQPTPVTGDQREFACFRSASSTIEKNALVQFHRDICEGFILHSGSASRVEFQAKHYRTYRWLLRNDKDWFGREMPILRGKLPQLQLFDQS